MTKGILLFLGVLLSLSVAEASVSYAEDTSMEAFRREFLEETGKTWEEADSEEKKQFVRSHQKSAETEEETGQSQPKQSADPGGVRNKQNIETTLDVRRQFQKQSGKAWETVTPEVQKQFLRDLAQKRQKEIERRRKEIEKRERERQNREKQRLAEKKRQGDQKRRIERRKQQENQRRQKDMEKKRKEMDKKLKELQKRHKR